MFFVLTSSTYSKAGFGILSTLTCFPEFIFCIVVRQKPLFKKHQWKDLENILGESTGKGSRLKEMLSKMFAFTPVVPALGLKEDK